MTAVRRARHQDLDRLVPLHKAAFAGSIGPVVGDRYIRAFLQWFLEAPDAIKRWRTLMGATDPAKADSGTLRKEFGQSIEFNATHGSDAPETAAFELGYFFRGLELR